jgi:hypothetical protein
MSEAIARPGQPIPVPTLAEALADATVLARLPLDALVRLRQQVRHLDASLEAEITTRLAAGSGPAAPAAADHLLDVTEAAAIAGVKPIWLYRNADRLPFARRLSAKCLRFSAAGLQKWLTTRGP